MIARCYVLFGLVALALHSGCASLAPKATPSLTAELTKGASEAERAPGYVVEFRDADGRKVQAVQKPLTESRHVQEVLKETRALSKWRKVHLDLIRPLPGGGEHRMKMQYSASNKRVEPEHDYEMHPGDRIVVTEDNSTFVDEMAKKLAPMTAGLSQGGTAKSKYQVRH